MADQCASAEQRPIHCFAAVYGSDFTVVECDGTPFVFLQGLRPAHWKDPDASLYRIEVRQNAIRFMLLEKCARLDFMPFHTESPELFFIFRRNPIFDLLLRAINQLIHEHQPNPQPDRFPILRPRHEEV